MKMVVFYFQLKFKEKMICLHCGYCCKNYFVPIIDNPNLNMNDNVVMHTGDGTPCKHLKGDQPGNYLCAIHDHPDYNETPCFQFTQIETTNSNCRMGDNILKS